LQRLTQGLPRVEEIFEARKPKGLAVITEIHGTVQLKNDGKKTEAVISNEEGEAEKYLIPFGSKLKVKDGDEVEAGDELTEGSVNPHDILKIKGVKGVQAYMLKEVQSVYRLQGVEISDKHIEVIIRQMLRKVQVEESGDTSMLPGEVIDIFRFESENERVMELGGEPAVAKRKLLGITKTGYRFVPFRRILPGDHKGADRGRYKGQGRPAGGFEGERHPRQADPRWRRLEALPQRERRGRYGRSVNIVCLSRGSPGSSKF